MACEASHSLSSLPSLPSSALPSSQPDAMLLLHEIISRGAALPCPDHDCLLASHPRVLQLLPYIAQAAARATTQPSRGGWVRQHTHRSHPPRVIDTE